MFQDLLPGTALGPKDGQNFEHGWQNDHCEAYLISNVGRVRQHNEDCAVICAPADPEMFEGHGAMFAVADGMGGASAGEVASHMALQNLVEHYFQGEADQEIPSSLREAIQEANAKIHRHAQENPDCKGMGTTVSALVIKDNWAFIAQVGDSRVYLLRQGLGLRQLTRDHSYVAKQIRKGELSPEEAENHELKNLITRSVGIKDKVKVDLFHLELQPSDTFLICSDGLCGILDDAEIADIIKIRGVRTKTFTLINKALEAGGYDNVSVICIQVHKLTTKAPAPQPTMIKPHLQGATPKPQEPAAPPAEPKPQPVEDQEPEPFEGLEGLDDDFESFDSIHIDLESEHGVEEEDKEGAPRKSGPHMHSRKSVEKPPLVLWITVGIGALLIVSAALWMYLSRGSAPTPSSPPATPSSSLAPAAPVLHPAIEAFEATGDYASAMNRANRLLAQQDNLENKNAIEELRNRFTAQITALLEKSPYTPQDQETALELVREALRVDEHPAVQQLQLKAQHEVAAHKFMLLSLDGAQGTATFALNNPYYPERQQTVAQGDLLQDRFRVELITPQRVRLADTKTSGPAGHRMLTAQLHTAVTGD